MVCGIKRVLVKGNTPFAVKPGPKGLLLGNLVEITDADVGNVINTGRFVFPGTHRTKIKCDH